MSDYYSYAPLHTLAKPLALCGIPGAEVGRTARVATMLTGIPLCRLAHRVAHLAGQSHERALLVQGEQPVLDLELKQLRAAIDGRTPPVIALSPVALTDPRIRRLVLDRTDLLHLRIDLREALARIRQDAAGDPSKHLHVRDGGTADDDAVLARLRFLDRLCREAPDHIAIDGRLPLQVGRQLAARFEGDAPEASAG